MTIELSALAARSCSGGTRRGIIALRAGALSAAQTAWRATIAYRNQTRWKPANAAPARATESAAEPAALARPSLRRSTVSATAPPYRPKATSGTREKRPTSPTEKGEPVMSYTWREIARAVMPCPTQETVFPNQRRR